MDDDALAYLSITRLQQSYADIATRMAWSEIGALVIPDARLSFDTRSGPVVEIAGAEAFASFGAKATARYSFYEYIPLNFVVAFAADRTARGRSYSLEVCEDRDTRDWISYYGFYHDDYALFDGTWRFARRRYQTLGRRTGGRLEAYPLPDRPR